MEVVNTFNSRLRKEGIKSEEGLDYPLKPYHKNKNRKTNLKNKNNQDLFLKKNLKMSKVKIKTNKTKTKTPNQNCGIAYNIIVYNNKNRINMYQ